MSLPVQIYDYEENYQGRPWDRKAAAQPHARRISFDSLMERPKMHSRTPSIDSSISSLSSTRNKLQKKSKHHSSPSSWSHASSHHWSASSSPTNKPLPSLPIWHSQYEIKSEEEYRRRVAQATQARSDMARQERQMYEGVVDPEKLTVRPSRPDFGDSWVMERPRRRGTYTGKKGWKFYREAFTNFRNRNKND